MVQTKHGEISVEQLAEIQPGMARIMDEYARRFWILYYAGKAANWKLARYMLNEVVKLGKVVAVVRPKYVEAMERFDQDSLGPIGAAIASADWAAFEAAYHRAVQASDDYHDRFAKPFIRFRLPPEPPPWIEFDPR